MAQRAFTLLELLVVVAILALLLSVLLPSISAAREAGFVLRCPWDARCESAVSKEKNPYNASASATRSRRLSASDHSGRTAPDRPNSEFRTRPPRPSTVPASEVVHG